MMFFKNFLLLLAAAHDSSANKELSQAATEDLPEDTRSFRGAAAGGPKGTSPVAGSSFFLPKPSVASVPGRLRSPRRLTSPLPEEIFLGPDGDNGFGESVAVSASAIVVGAYKFDDYKGRAYIFTPDENGSYKGATQTTLEAQDAGDFGLAVAASENVVVIGAPNSLSLKSEQGAMHQFNINGFLSEAFTAHSLKSGDLFGESVAAWNDEFVIGARYDDSNGSYSGAVYLSSGQKLIADDGSAYDKFGFSVALSDGILVVGAPNRNAAYVFENVNDGTGYGQRKKLTTEDGRHFGASVAMSKERVCIGAPGAPRAEAVYCYNLEEEFELEKKLQGRSEGNERFGCSLALSGTTLVVGAKGAWGVRGAIYVYKFGYDNPTKISPESVGDDAVSGFGVAVAIAGNKVVVGSTSEHVFVYDISELTYADIETPGVAVFPGRH